MYTEQFPREESDVSSGVGAEVGSGMMTIAVTPLADDWHFAKRKVSGTWANAGVFIQIWERSLKAPVSDHRLGDEVGS